MPFFKSFTVSLLIPIVLSAGEPINVLFIGNSYTGQNGLAHLVAAMATELPDPVQLRVSTHTPGGCTFQRHMIEGKAIEKVKSFQPNFVVLQEQSQMPVFEPVQTLNAGRALGQLVQEAGATPVLYMTWARKHIPDQIKALSETYFALGEKLQAPVAPVGLAWSKALREKPEWALHKKDKSHPNQQGSYLAACVILATILNVDITELPDKGFTLKSVTSEQAAYYQKLAQQHAESVEGSAP